MSLILTINQVTNLKLDTKLDVKYLFKKVR
jgi:hypothetical protein